MAATIEHAAVSKLSLAGPAQLGSARSEAAPISPSIGITRISGTVTSETGTTEIGTGETGKGTNAPSPQTAIFVDVKTQTSKIPGGKGVLPPRSVVSVRVNDKEPQVSGKHELAQSMQDAGNLPVPLASGLAAQTIPTVSAGGERPAPAINGASGTDLIAVQTGVPQLFSGQDLPQARGVSYGWRIVGHEFSGSLRSGTDQADWSFVLPSRFGDTRPPCVCFRSWPNRRRKKFRRCSASRRVGLLRFTLSVSCRGDKRNRQCSRLAERSQTRRKQRSRRPERPRLRAEYRSSSSAPFIQGRVETKTLNPANGNPAVTDPGKVSYQPAPNPHLRCSQCLRVSARKLNQLACSFRGYVIRRSCAGQRLVPEHRTEGPGTNRRSGRGRNSRWRQPNARGGKCNSPRPCLTGGRTAPKRSQPTAWRQLQPVSPRPQKYHERIRVSGLIHPPGRFRRGRLQPG